MCKTTEMNTDKIIGLNVHVTGHITSYLAYLKTIVLLIMLIQFHPLIIIIIITGTIYIAPCAWALPKTRALLHTN